MLSRIQDGITGKLAEAGLHAEVFGREKSLFTIYRKMREKRLSFSQVLDLYGFRVIVDNVPSCYLALEALHSLFKAVPRKFKVHTTWDRFHEAVEINDLLLDGGYYVDRVFNTLKDGEEEK